VAAGAYCLFMPDNAAPIEPRYKCFMGAAPYWIGYVYQMPSGTYSWYQDGRCSRKHWILTIYGQRFKIEHPVWGVQTNRMYAPWIKFSVNA
jgi:hypothetical protein